jgi:perosamine synthetase
MIRVALAEPYLIGNERRYVLDAMDKGELTWRGAYVERFEHAFAKYVGARYAIACCNGTAALHLALRAAGVERGMRVAMPTLTYVATANAVRYCEAVPVFCDVDPETWQMRLDYRRHDHVDAILPVHLYGIPATSVSRSPGLVVEDAAEAFGALFDGVTHVGMMGAAGSFSFYANKILTCGEGGIVVTNDEQVAAKARLLRGQAQSPDRLYWHVDVGFNYRMTNLQAAVALGQIEKAGIHLSARLGIFDHYRFRLRDESVSWPRTEHVTDIQAPWMFVVQLPPYVNRDSTIEKLAGRGVETRPAFACLHTMPPYATGEQLPHAQAISASALCLPTHGGLTYAEVDYVCDSLLEIIRRAA